MIEKLSKYYFNKGLKYSRNNFLSLALECLKKSVALDSNNINSWNLLGLCYFKFGYFEMSKICFNESLQISREDNSAVFYSEFLEANLPKFKDSFIQVLNFIKRKKYEKAFKIINEDIPTTFKKTTAMLNYIGILKKLMNKTSSALESWNETLSLDITNEMANLYINCCKQSDKITLHSLTKLFKKR